MTICSEFSELCWTLTWKYIIAKKKYRIIYTVRVEAKKVIIVRIAHMKGDAGTMIMALEEE